MSWQLSRVRLCSVGPDGARFDPVSLDFTVDGRGADSVLWLENGGGKTVLLKLLFGVVRPDKIAQLGSEEGRSKGLPDLVLGADTAHVVLEWVRPSVTLTGEPERLVTGLVMEWEGKAVSADASRLRRCWYSFRPRNGGLSFDDLPVHAEGRRVSFAGYKTRLAEAQRNDRGHDLVAVDTQSRWLTHLSDNVGLDPVLFAYQITMNRDEAGAAKLFQFRSDSAFVDFLLELIVDDAGVSQVAENLAKHIEKLSRLPAFQLELRFVEGAVDRLRPVAEGAERHRQASSELATATIEAARLRGAIDAAAEERAADAELHAQRARQAEEAKGVANRRRRRLAEEAAELRRRVAEIDLAAAAEALAGAEAAETDARLRGRAARDAELLVRRSQLTSQVKALRAALDAAEQDAAPLRAQADRLAEALAAQLARVRAANEADREAASTAADDHTSRADQAAAEQRRLAGEAATLAERRRQLEGRIDRRDRERARLVEDGALSPDERGADALARLDAADVADAQRLGEIDAEESARVERHEAIGAEEKGHVAAREAALAEVERLDAELSRLQEEVSALAVDRRLAELADSHDVDVVAANPMLSALVADTVTAGERRRLDLEVAGASDRRAVAALTGIEGLLPSAVDVEEAVAALGEAGIAAVSGWRYLAHSTHPQRRAAVIAARPDLAGGVIVVDGTPPDEAAECLSRRAAPPTVIAVGGPEEMAAAETAPPRPVVAPTPALYDQAAAAEDLEVRHGRLAALQADVDAVAAQVRGDRQLLDRLVSLARDCPPGHLEALDHQVEAARVRQAAAVAALAELESESRELREAANRARAERSRLSAAAHKRGPLRGRLQSFAVDEDDAAGWPEELAGIVATSARCELDAAEAKRLEDDERRRAAEATQLAAAKRAALERIDAEIAALGVTAAAAAEVADIEALRAERAEMLALIDERTVRSDAAVQHERATRDLEGATLAVDALDAEVVAAAEALLDSPDGADQRSRSAAATRADVEATRLAGVTKERFAAHEQAKAELNAATAAASGPGAVLFDDVEAAADRSGLEARRQASMVEHAEMQARETVKDAEQKAEQAAATAAASEAKLLEAHARRIGVDAVPAAAFAGTAEAAGAAVDDAVHRLDAARTAAADAERAVTDAVASLHRFVGGKDFATIGGPKRDRLVDTAEVVAADAPRLITQLELRASTLRSDIGDIDRHRDVLVSGLAVQVEAALNALKKVQSVSKLPDTLGDWAGRQFLQIAYTAPADADELRTRLGILVAELSQLDPRSIPGGNQLLSRAVHAVVGADGFRPRVLKPTASGQVRYVGVTEMGKLSGGMRATAAIQLYCTLANLRADHRSRRGSFGVGTLVLDNPIGTASATYLVEIQRRVADARGVQLLYTTGIKDLDALRQFTNVIRLRNDAELRSHMHHVRVDPDAAANLLGGRAADDAAGYLSATAQHRIVPFGADPNDPEWQ